MNYPDPEYVVMAGSHGYGTSVETSDEDFRGFFMPSRKALLGFLPESDSYVSPEGSKSDVALWEIRKFFKMCAQANPNVIETLFLPEKNIIRATPLARDILAIRDRFLSKRLARTYMGYATGNWKRVMATAVRAAETKAYGSRAPHISWSKEYDTKDAMHLIRLLRTGAEVLRTGQLRVQRPEDRKYFLSIRIGDVALGDLMEEVEWSQSCWKDLEVASSLPEEPDETFLNDFLVELLGDHLSDTLVYDQRDPRA